jgi:hypothetical protein
LGQMALEIVAHFQRRDGILRALHDE